MPRIGPQREAAMRQSILLAAREVFVRKGFDQATTHDVARAAGVSVGSIYTYFPSKDELIRECVLAANQAENEAVLQDIRADGSISTRISRAIAGWYRFTLEAPGVPAFLAEAWAAASRKPPIRDMVGRRQQRLVTTATILLQEGVAAGELAADLEVERAARAIAALLDGVVLECLASGVAPSRLDVERRVLLLVGSIAEPSAGPGPGSRS
jgi:AcrR family transcriptional regulator